MKKMHLFLSVLLLISWGCEDENSGTPQSTFTRTFGGSGLDYGNSVQQTMDGGYVIAGIKERQPPFLYQVWLIKTHSQGGEEWNKTFGGYSWDYGLSVQQTMDGGYIVGGNSIVETCADCWSNDFILINYKPNAHRIFLIALVKVHLETYIFLTIYLNGGRILKLQKMITLISAYQLELFFFQ